MSFFSSGGGSGTTKARLEGGVCLYSVHVQAGQMNCAPLQETLVAQRGHSRVSPGLLPIPSGVMANLNVARARAADPFVWTGRRLSEPVERGLRIAENFLDTTNAVFNRRGADDQSVQKSGHKVGVGSR